MRRDSYFCKNADFGFLIPCPYGRENDGGKNRKGVFFMKKGKIWIVVLIGLLLAGGLVVAGCSKGCPRGACDYGDATGTTYTTCGESSCSAGFRGSACNC